MANLATVQIADAGMADHNAAGYVQAALDLAEGRRLLLRAALALKAEPNLPVAPSTHVSKAGLLHIGGSESVATVAEVINRVADRIEGALALECPALRQATKRSPSRRVHERSAVRG